MDYVKEIKKFEKSPLFKNAYSKFIATLKLSGQTFPSKHLEAMVGVSGAEIRKLAQYARRKGVLINSGSKGYSYASTKREADSTLNHLKKRAESLQVTINAIEQSTHYKRLAKR